MTGRFEMLEQCRTGFELRVALHALSFPHSVCVHFLSWGRDHKVPMWRYCLPLARQKVTAVVGMFGKVVEEIAASKEGLVACYTGSCYVDAWCVVRRGCNAG